MLHDRAAAQQQLPGVGAAGAGMQDHLLVLHSMPYSFDSAQPHMAMATRCPTCPQGSSGYLAWVLRELAADSSCRAAMLDGDAIPVLSRLLVDRCASS